LGDCYVQQKNYREAETYYLRALAIQERSGQVDAQLALTLQRYASLLKATRRKSEATGMRRRAQTILRSNPAAHTVNAKDFETTTKTWRESGTR
jgi:tetratricopeptide (TPR) repeat protein